MTSIFRKLIADLREERNMTIEQLSAMCGISSDVLSAMESGKARLPFTTLLRIIRSFSPSVSSLVLGKRERLSVTYADEYSKLAARDGDVTYIPLTPEFIGGHMTPYIVEIEKGVSWPDPASEMTGEYFVYVLEGNVEADLSGKNYSFGPGDSIYYDKGVAHSITNKNDIKAKLLIVLD